MAQKVFTGTDITLDTAFAVGGDASWIAAASTWDGTGLTNGDTGVISNVSGSLGGIHINSLLVDDASVPPDIHVSAIRIEFDWHVANAGGTAGANPHPDSDIISGGIAVQLANTDTTGHFDFTYVNAKTQFFGGGTPDRAALFAATYNVTFQATQRTGANTSRFAMSNFTVTVTYVNIGVGSWLIKTAPMTNETGSVDFTTFAPDIAQLTNPSQTGTIDVPIDDVAGAYIYLDGGATPVDIAGLPANFVPDSDFALIMAPGVQFSGDSVEAVLAPLIDALCEFANAAQTDYYFSGMDLSEMTALLGETIVTTLTTGGDPFVGILRCILESDSSSGWDPSLSVGIWGSYTISSGSLAISPDTGFTSGGLEVSISGGSGNFGVGTTVRFGKYFGEGVEATDVVVTDGTHLTCKTPPFPVAGDVSVIVSTPTFADEGILDGFTYIEPASDGGPGSFSLSPDHGPLAGGTVVTITANDFTFGASPRVFFDGLEATSVSGGGTGTLACTTPAHTPGLVNVVVYDS